MSPAESKDGLMDSPHDFHQLFEDPELAVLWALMANLDAAKAALLACYPHLWCEEHDKHRPTIPEAYASVIIQQGGALRAMLDAYFESVEHARAQRNRDQGDVEF